ncbi:18955_t:CDS:2, partial [Gigaspora rosea]
SVSESTEAQLKKKNSLVIEHKTINYGVEKMEDIIPVVKEKKKPEDIMLVDKKNNKLDVTKSIVEEI